MCVCVCVRANVDECLALEEHYIWWALNIGRGRTLSRKLKCQCVENIPTFRIALVQLGCGANTRTHSTAETTLFHQKYNSKTIPNYLIEIVNFSH